jgi:hypothetical protein
MSSLVGKWWYRDDCRMPTASATARVEVLAKP